MSTRTDFLRGPLARGSCVLLALGCVAASQATPVNPPHVNKFRLAASTGLTRDIKRDLELASPTDEPKHTAKPRWLEELSVHYGLDSSIEIGLRLQPIDRDVKVDASFLLLREPASAFGLRLGIGVEGTFQPRTRLGCLDGGCFSQRQWGVLADLPIVVSRHLGRHVILYASARYQHLVGRSEERFRSPAGLFTTERRSKTVFEPIGAWTLGLWFEGVRWQVLPQIGGSTRRSATGDLEHHFYPNLEVAYRF